jgi:hypothetical protein
MRVTRWCGYLTVVAVVAIAVGCGESGPKRHGVSGKVTWKNQEVRLGTITFIPMGSQTPAGGAQIIDGLYSIPAPAGLPAGKYKVYINYPDPKAAPKAEPVPGEHGEQKDLIPAKYNTDSELTVEVTAEGPNEHNFDLK